MAERKDTSILLRLLDILCSRWSQGVVFVLLVAAIAFRAQGWWIAAASVAGVYCAALILSFLPVWRELNRVWHRFPHTSEYAEYTSRREAENDKENKNKIEIE